jgi:general secretion pathway protein N
MIRFGTISGLLSALLAGAVVFGAAAAAPAATPPAALDPLERAMNPAMDPVAEPERPAVPVARETAPTGNPLWAFPLRLLTATRERPIFSPSRRPPAPAVVAAPRMPPPAPVVKPAEPDHPPLEIVGTIVGGSDGIGVFIDETTRGVVRLKTGQVHDGWVLRSIEGREATFEKDRRKAKLTLPAPGADQSTQAQAPLPVSTGAQGDGAWIDGDGQRIAPPKRTSQPIGASPAAATPAGSAL